MRTAENTDDKDSAKESNLAQNEFAAPSARAKALREEILGSALSLEEAAYVLGLDRTTVAKYLRDHVLVGFQIGREWLVPEEELRDYVRRLVDQRRRAVRREEAASEAGQPGWLDRVRRELFGSRRSESDDRADRFTPRARVALSQAGAEAIALNHQFIGTEHLLLALVSSPTDDQNTATNVLDNLGVPSRQVRQEVETRIHRGDSPPNPRQTGLTVRARKAVELAVDETRRLKQDKVGTEHLLLGLVREGDGIAAQVLSQLGLTLEVVRAETRRVHHGPDQPTSDETAL